MNADQVKSDPLEAGGAGALHGGQAVGGDAPASLADKPATAILQAVARGWCHPRNSHKEMDSDLAIAIAAEVSALLDTGSAVNDGWIAVDERMPEPGTECLVYGPHWFSDRKEISIDTWDEQHEAPVSFSSATIPVGLGWDSDSEVTHWMPLPAPPASDASARMTPEASTTERAQHLPASNERSDT